MTFSETINTLNLTDEQRALVEEGLAAEYLSKAEAEEQAKKARECFDAELSALRLEKEGLDRKIRLDSLEREVAAAGARNPGLIMSLLGAEEKSIEESRGVLEQLKSSDPYLFDGGCGLKGFRPEPSSDNIPKPAFSDMTYSETLAYLQGNK